MRKMLKALAVALAVATSASLASASELVPAAGLESVPVPAFQRIDEVHYTGTTGQRDALMQPILPLMNVSAGSTTTISQIGRDNFATAGVEGSRSLAAIAQIGSNNRAVQAIEGNSSALLLVQAGRNNNVIQASQGNDNFQIVGVAGSNNNVGYIQSGNELGGVLGVSGVNSNVIAFQNGDSARFLMPANLTGLRNQTVVIVPGRMYVFPNR